MSDNEERRYIEDHANATAEDVEDFGELFALAESVNKARAAAAEIVGRLLQRHRSDNLAELFGAKVIGVEEMQALEDIMGATQQVGLGDGDDDG
jgi:hypothetical protein